MQVRAGTGAQVVVVGWVLVVGAQVQATAARGRPRRECLGACCPARAYRAYHVNAGGAGTSMAPTCLLLLALLSSTSASKVRLNIHFSESAFDAVWDDPEAGKTPGIDCSLPGADMFLGPCFSAPRYFLLSWYTCLTVIGTSECPGGQGTFNKDLAIYASDKAGTDLWTKEIDTGSSYTGILVFSLAVPIATDVSKLPSLAPFVSPLKECVVKPECTGARTPECLNAYPRLQGELCNQIGTPYTVTITDPSAAYTVEAYPAFGFMSGSATNLLTAFPSPTLDIAANIAAGMPSTTRDVPVYVPPSLLQNKVARKLNIMVTFDSDLTVVESFAFRAGFEHAQLTGDAPESILIGIGVLQFAFAGNLAQRTYELTWDQTLDDRYSCNGAAEGIDQPLTGGSDKLLTWIDTSVIPAVLSRLSSLHGSTYSRGEVSIAGGSLGGLTSCYAAAQYPQIFSRAICMALTNCHNFAAGGLTPVITGQYLRTGKKAVTVMQFLSSEIYARPGDRNQTKNPRPTPELNPDHSVYPQLQYMRSEQEAWMGIGMQASDFGASTGFSPSSLTGGVYRPYDASFSTYTATESSVVASYLWPGGQHCAQTWEDYFAFAMDKLYRAQPAAHDVSTTPHDGVRRAASEAFRHMFIIPMAAATAAAAAAANSNAGPATPKAAAASVETSNMRVLVGPLVAIAVLVGLLTGAILTAIFLPLAKGFRPVHGSESASTAMVTVHSPEGGADPNDASTVL